MTRAVDEWVAAHDDQAIPRRVKLRVWERCGGRCAISGQKLRPGDAYDFDHVVPLRDGGRHAEGNLQVVARTKHREKTAAEAGDRAKVDRIRAKHTGAWPKSKRPLRSKGFAPARKDSRS